VLGAFVSLIEPLHAVTGPLMFQFGYLNKSMMASPEAFLARLVSFARQLPEGHTYGVEVRNPNYLSTTYWRSLADNALIPVLLQGYWMPPITSVYRNWRSLIAQHKTVVVRLLGPDREGIEELTHKRWNALAVPRDKELQDVAEMVHDLLDRGVSVYVNVNNHYEGSAPLTIERLQQLL
jgi:uncharacterized protein YecE (DUF72 family)